MDPLLSTLVATLPPISSDELPSPEHQQAVTSLAEEYLQCVGTPAGHRLREIAGWFDQHPLLALEVLDEAYVLHKNQHNLWGNTAAQARDPACVSIAPAFNKFTRIVDGQRGGRHRSSTTPTLKGGALRSPPADVSGAPSFLPLIFALKDLRVRYFTSQLDSPAQFSRSACLVRGEAPLSTGNEAKKAEWRQSSPQGPLPEDPMAALLLSDLGPWPADAFIAVRGILAFGPGDEALARQCALHALKLNQECTLALQLLELLSQKHDQRVPFKDLQTELKDVLDKMGATTAPTREQIDGSAASTISVEGSSLDECRQKISSRLEPGQYVLREEVVSTGNKGSISASGLTSEEAFASAEDKIGKLHGTPVSRTEVRPARRFALQMEAESEGRARNVASGQAEPRCRIESVVTKTAGRKGLFGIGARLPTYEVQFTDPAEVSVTYAVPTRLVAHLGRTPGNWTELVCAVRFAKQATALMLLRTAFPYHVGFVEMNVTSGNDVSRYEGLPFSTVSDQAVETARRWVESPRVPPALAEQAGDWDRAWANRVPLGSTDVNRNPRDPIDLALLSCFAPDSTSKLRSATPAVASAVRAMIDPIFSLTLGTLATSPALLFFFSLPRLQSSDSGAARLPTNDEARQRVIKGVERMVLEAMAQPGEWMGDIPRFAKASVLKLLSDVDVEGR